MYGALVQSIRLRMREQSTEQLLALWTTNDRVMWSPEAFEAVKAVLAERGHAELPKQNDPAPIASRFNRLSPEAQYWLGWLRPVVWIAMAPAVLSLTEAPGTLGALVNSISSPSTAQFTPGELATHLLGDLIVPVWLIVGGTASLRLKRWGRHMLLLYPLAVLVLEASNLSDRYRVETDFESNGVWWTVGFVRTLLLVLLETLTVPAIVIVLLRRAEIRALFMPSATGFSVEPAPAAPDTQSGG
jgi:hypothetical protein